MDTLHILYRYWAVVVAVVVLCALELRPPAYLKTVAIRDPGSAFQVPHNGAGDFESK